ncbi:MAG: adenosine deaminase [Armatimonadetes bacterium]|nr:adenosine deaminase [Armatimonadota bacterium]
MNDDLLRRMPKVELHRHLEGAFRPEWLLEIAQENGIPLPASNTESLRPYVQVTAQDRSLLDFLGKFSVIGQVFTSPLVIERLTFKVIEEAARENIHYIELRFDPCYMSLCRGIPMPLVAEAILSGRDRAKGRYPKTQVRFIVILQRQLGTVMGEKALQIALAYQDQGFVGVDLAGDEVNVPPEPFAGLFSRAERAGFGITLHAGEARGSESVRAAIETCNAQRIGHGVRITEDPSLRELIRERGIPLEICVTSNIQTGASRTYEEHPIRSFYESGIQVTVSTDDPGVSGIDLTHEYGVLKDKLCFTAKDLQKMNLAAAEAAFLPLSEKTALKESLELEYRKYSQ